MWDLQSIIFLLTVEISFAVWASLDFNDALCFAVFYHLNVWTPSRIDALNLLTNQNRLSRFGSSLSLVRLFLHLFLVVGRTLLTNVIVPPVNVAGVFTTQSGLQSIQSQSYSPDGRGR